MQLISGDHVIFYIGYKQDRDNMLVIWRDKMKALI